MEEPVSGHKNGEDVSLVVNDDFISLIPEKIDTAAIVISLNTSQI